MSSEQETGLMIDTNHIMMDAISNFSTDETEKKLATCANCSYNYDDREYAVCPLCRCSLKR